MNIKQIVEQILTENELGKPWSWGDNAAGFLIPILRTGEIPDRLYLMLEEVKDKVKIEDTGHISQARLVNLAGLPVFVRGGGILAGQDTQSRAFQKGAILMPGKQELPINCVHASHGIRPNAYFDFSGYAPRKVERALRNGNQNEVWNSVQASTIDMRQQALRNGGQKAYALADNFQSDNLVGTMEKIAGFKSTVDDAIRRMPREPNQVGVAIFDVKGVVGVELFDHPDSWKALCESVLKQYGDVFEQEVPDYLKIDPNKVVANVRAFFELAKEANEEPEQDGTVVIRGKGITGEYTVLTKQAATSKNRVVLSKLKEPRLIHFLLSREEKEKETANHHQRQAYYDYVGPYQTDQSEKQTLNLSRQNINTSNSTFSALPAKVETLLENLQTPKTWKQLEPLFKSTNTQSRITKAAIEAGLVEHFQNGDNIIKYRLTARGTHLLSRNK